MFHGFRQLVSLAITAFMLVVVFVVSSGTALGQVYSGSSYPSTPYPSSNSQPATRVYTGSTSRYTGTATQPVNTSNSRVISVSTPTSNTFRTQSGTYSQPPASFAQSTGSTNNTGTTLLTPVAESLVTLTVSEANIESAATEVNNSASLSSDEKSIAQSTLQKALQWIQQSRGDSYKAGQLAAEIRSAPSRLDSLQRLLATPAQTSVRIPEGYAMTDLLGHRERLVRELNSARDSFAEMVSRYGGEAIVNAGDQWSRQLNEAESELRSLQSSTAAASLTDIKAKCDNFQRQTRKEALQTRIELMRRQMNFNENHSDLFEAELATGRRQIQAIDTQIAAIDEAVENSKASSAFRLGDRARAIASNSHPLVGELARYNAGLADDLALISNSRRDVNTRIETTRQKLTSLREDYESVRTKLAQYGLTPTIGALLRHRRDQLDPVHVQLAALRDVHDRMSNAQREQLELDLQRTQLDNLESETDLWINNSLYAGSLEAQQYRPQIYQMLAERRDLVDQLSNDYRLYQKRLDELDTTTTDAATTITAFRGLIDKHVTWIRSGSPLGAVDIRTAWSGLGSLFDARHSQQFTSDLRTKLSMSPLYGFYLCFSILAVGLIRWKAKATLAQIGKQRQIKQLGLRWTIAAAALTFVLSLIFPACFFLIGQWLADPQATTETLLSVSAGFYAAALVLWLIELPRQLTRPFGIVDKHMDWKLPSRERAFKTLSILAMILVPLAMGVSIVSQMDQGRWRESLGRIGFLLAMLVVAVVAHRALRPKQGFVPALFLASRTRWAYRFRHLWYAFGVSFPLLMAVLSAMGYGYTSQVLLTRLIITALVMGLLWLVVNVIKTVASQLWIVWADDGDGRVELIDDDASHGMELRAGYLRRQKYDLLQQRLAFLARGAVAFGVVVTIASLWTDIIPNLNVANPTLWTVHETTTQYTASLDGSEVAKLVPTATPITAVDLLLAVATLFFTFHIARTLPLVLDVLLLDFMITDEGMHHLLLVMGRAVLCLVGVVFAASWIGLRWETIQWLVVALVIGLGFGMQDMVRNFIGGLFVLLEKPASPGDLVTVGKLTGRIAIQRLRTTALVDDEGRELIIPNRKFMSEDVTNWTGAGRLCPLTVDVELSKEIRGSDASAMLLGIASRNPSVMTSPEPKTTFVCAGKSTQQIELRVWLDKKTDVAKIRSELQSQVASALRSESLGSASTRSSRSLSGSTISDSLTSLRPRRRSA